MDYMKKKLIVFWALALTSVQMLSGQVKLPDKCGAFYPEMLNKSAVLSETTVSKLMASKNWGQGIAPRFKKFWIVYSDRENNTTWTEPGGSTKHSSLAFGEKVRIALIKNGFALVYTEPRENVAYPMLSQDAVCRGWISMDRLLLWRSCPANECGIYNKALLCVNVDAEHSGSSGKLYKDPQKKGKPSSLKADMKFYFIMKRVGDMALLANMHTMEGLSDGNVLLGWVANESYVPWNQRSCLEPTWNIDDVEYFAARKDTVRIFEDKGLKNNITYLSFKKKEGTDRYKYRMTPNALRFPILDDGTTSLYNCSSFSNIGGKGGNVLELTEEEAKRIRTVQESLTEASELRMVFVIDGTSSMENYFPAVKKAIEESRQFFAENKYSIKVGAVIYRDYCDGEYVVETCPWNVPEHPRLKEFLDKGGKYGVKSSRTDRTLEEALYKGINTALDSYDFNPRQSNIMFVVGDCANDRSDTKILPEHIIKKLVDKNVHFMGFQVRNDPRDAFKLFNTQMLYIMKESVRRKYDILASAAASGKKPVVNIKETPTGYETVNDYKSDLYVGSHSYTGQNKVMSADELTRRIEGTISLFAKSIDYQKGLIGAAADSDASWMRPDVDLPEDVAINKEYLKRRLGDKFFDQLSNSGAFLSFKGYTKKSDASGRKYYKPVIFISSDEFTALIERLRPVNDAAVSAANDREPYINAMKALTQSLLPGISNDEMNSMGVKEVMGLVSGLNEASASLKGHTILEISSPKAVPNAEYQSLVNDFKTKFRSLQRIKASPYKYVREVNGVKYYWIPIEDLP